MTEFQVNGIEYRSDRMDAKKQFHVARRIAPLLAGLGDMAKGKSSGFVELLAPIAEALSKMSDDDTDYVIDACLAVVKRKQGETWQSVATRNGALMFEDIDLAVMIQLTVAVIQQNLGSFFPVGPSTSIAAA